MRLLRTKGVSSMLCDAVATNAVGPASAVVSPMLTVDAPCGGPFIPNSVHILFMTGFGDARYTAA